MENNFIEREAIGTFIDMLIEKKHPGKSINEDKESREKSIDIINETINRSILDSLNSDQLDELNNLLDQDNGDPSVYARFFERSGVDIEQKINDVLGAFQESYLGGSNE